MGACVDRLSLAIGEGSSLTTELDAVKLYLRVEHAADDDLITALIASAKQRADDYLQNPFTALQAVIIVGGAEVGDSVGVDGITFRIASEEPAIRTQTLLLQDFVIGADDADTAENLAEIINDETYGALQVEATASDTEVALAWRDGRTSTVAASEVNDTLAVRATRVELEIPEVVKTGVLRTIAWLYDQRQDRVAQEAVSGLGTTQHTADPLALELWAPHRKLVGL